MRNSIDDHFRNFDDDKKAMKTTVKGAIIGAGIGFVAGAVGGYHLGVSINEYVEVLNQAPDTIKYAVNGGSAFVVGMAGSTIGVALGQLKGIYNFLDNF